MKRMMKRWISAALCLALAAALVGCAGQPAEAGGATQAPGTDGFDAASAITVVSREDGSGTRSAFVELTGVLAEDESGEEVDRTTVDAVTTSSTNVMMTTVAGNEYAIGYISLGSLNETVKALSIDGTAATAENVANGSYKIARPFNIAYKGSLSAVAQDFVDFILSADGQAVIEAEGYIAVDAAAAAYAGSKPAGSVTISGSSSVTPVMEKLKEAYEAINPDADIAVTQSDSSTGMSDAINGISDIGMASRAVKDSELAEGLTAVTIATDGIAVIVNNNNPAVDMTVDEVQAIYTGSTTTWEGLVG